MQNWLNRIYNYNVAGRQTWIAAQAANIHQGQRVLDVGAGTAPYRSLFSHCDYRTHDFGQAPSLEGRYAQLDYVSDIISIPVPDQSFDVIICTEVLEHVPEPIRAIQEFARILKSGGRLLLTAPLGSWLHMEPFHFYGGYTSYWYRRFLPEAGFTIECIEKNHGFFTFFGQEAIRFSRLIDPRYVSKRGLTQCALALLWLVTLPLFRGLLPVLANLLDQLELEHIATVGYYVAAVKTQKSKGDSET